MSRSLQLTIAILAALAATLAFLILRDRGPGGAPAARVAAGRASGADGSSRIAKPGTDPASGGAAGAASRPATDESAEEQDDSGLPSAPPDTIKMPDTAAGFFALFKELARLQKDTEEDDERLHQAMDAFVRLLSDNPEQRRAAIELFMKEKKSGVLKIAALALGRVDCPEMHEAMIRIAQGDASAARRQQALVVLGFFQSSDAVPVALQILRAESDVKMQNHAIGALPDQPPAGTAEAQRGEVAGELTKFTQSPDVLMRESAYRKLGDWSDEGGTPTLLSGLKDPQMTVRAAAAYALALRAERSPDAKTTLLRLLQDAGEHVQVRGVAADALAEWAKRDAEIQRAVDAFRTWEAQNPQPAQELPASKKQK